jgi:two-component system, LytTR family, response regulator LytT
MNKIAKLRIVILEDEWPARNYLVELLEGTGRAEVVGAIATAQEARDLVAAPESAVDVLFVDVQLAGDGDKAGIELIRDLAKGASPPPAFVLATAFKQHALEAFELGVVDYLLKPFSEDRVAACIERLAARLGDKAAARDPATPNRIVARKGRSLVFLEPSEVWAFEAADRLTCVHSARGKFDVDLSLATIESSLGRSFARVHRNWLVNAAHIKQLDRDGSETSLMVGTETGITVPVARERSQGVRDMLLSNAMGVRRA